MAVVIGDLGLLVLRPSTGRLPPVCLRVIWRLPALNETLATPSGVLSIP